MMKFVFVPNFLTVAAGKIDDDDPENSGIHVDDSLNKPDSIGRVLVNVSHPNSDPDAFLAPQIARIVKPHQVSLYVYS